LSNLKDIPVRHAASQRQRYCTPGNLEDGPARSIEKLEEEICELGQQLADERKEVAIAANRRKTRTKRKVRQETQDFFGDLAEDVVAAVVQYVHKLGDAESNKFLSFFDANEPAINVSRLLRQAFLEYLDSAHDNELTTFVEKVQALEQQITLLQEANASLGRKLEDLRARTFADIRS
jgi:NTP pyrophosphatase (non-canonical NTP hydrolase)